MSTILKPKGGGMKPIWWFLIFVFTMASIGQLGANTPPQVSNVSAAQRLDGSKIVDIWYGVNDADNDTLTVSVAVSNDNGATFVITPSPANLSGAIGENILSGTNKHIIWNAGAEGVSFDGSQFKVKVTATEKINLSYGLVAYYPFNGNANDESGNGHDASTIGASFTEDRFGQLNHAASHSYDSRMFTNISINAAKSLVFWLKTDAQPTTGDGFGIGFLAPYPTSWAPNGSAFGFGYGIGSNHDLAFGGWWYDYSIQNQNYMWSNDNVWHMVAVTMDENYSCKIYIDGIRQMQLYENLTGNIVSEFTLTPSLFQFLIQWSASEGIPGYTVNVDDIRIYNRPITADEVTTIFHEGGWPNLNTGLVAYYPFNGNANDESGNGHDGIVYGALLAQDRFGINNKAYSFSNPEQQTQYIDAGSMDLSNRSFSCCFWSKSNGDCVNEWIIGHNNTGENYYCLMMGYQYNGRFCAGFFGDELWSPNDYLLGDAGWHFWGMCYDVISHTRSLYRDGILISQDNPVSNYLGYGDLRIGGARPLFENIGFNGMIDDVRIYSRTLSPSEIQALYHEGGWNGN